MNEEEKKAIEDMNRFANGIDMSCVTARQMQIILNLIEKKKNCINILDDELKERDETINKKEIIIEKLQKENTEQKAEIKKIKYDNKTLKEFVSAVFNEELNDKYIIHLTDKQYNAAIENAQNDINQKWIQKVKEINKGINSLMQSRKKWKYRYYKIKNKNKDLQKSVEQIYDGYKDIREMAFYYSDKLEQQEKIIDLMSEKIFEGGIVWDNKEEVKQYFENKAKELLNK